MVAGVISKAFGLTGAFTAVNSACASSLQAMLLAAPGSAARPDPTWRSSAAAPI